MRLLCPAGRGRRERREVAGNGESLRNVSRRERWARGTRSNAQTKTRSGGGEASEAVGAEQPLKKEKKIRQQRGHCPLQPLQDAVCRGESRSGPFTHGQIDGPTPIPRCRYETEPRFLGGRGPGRDTQGAGLGIDQQVSATVVPNPEPPASEGAASARSPPQSRGGDRPLPTRRSARAQDTGARGPARKRGRGP